MNKPRIEQWIASAILATSIMTLVPTVVNAQFQYPPYGSLRGRMVHRDGLFHSTRYRWGNGLTPYGASVMIAGFQTAGQIIPAIVTGEINTNSDQPSTNNEEGRSTKNRAGELGDWCAEYAAEQKRATDALERVEELLRAVTGVKPSPKPATEPAATKPTPAADAPPSVQEEEIRTTKPKQSGQVQAPEKN
jgi:hypothetical protein